MPLVPTLNMLFVIVIDELLKTLIPTAALVIVKFATLAPVTPDAVITVPLPPPFSIVRAVSLPRNEETPDWSVIVSLYVPAATVIVAKLEVFAVYILFAAVMAA